jgi:hypothetical protein
MLQLDKYQQSEIIRHIQDVYTNYDAQMYTWKTRMERIYKEVATFEEPRKNPRDPTFKVNKCHEVENKILPKIVARNPKRQVSYKDNAVLNMAE